jgi:hypothetical protein
LLLALAPACDGAPADPAAATCGDPCVLADDANYQFSSQLDIDTFTLQPQADVRITWPDVTTDLVGHPLDPAEIDQVTLVVFPDLTPDEAAAALASDTATQAAVGLYQVCTPTDGACLLSEFGLLGSRPGVDQYFEAGTGSWLLVLGEAGEAHGRALAFMEASADATDTTVVVTDDTYALTVDADLGALAPVALPAGTTAVVDWSALTADGFGNAMDIRTLDALEVARFDLSAAELEEQFLRVEDLDGSRWRADVSGLDQFDLAELEGDSPFTGIDTDGTWVLALRCSSCFHPAPRFLTLLTPAGSSPAAAGGRRARRLRRDRRGVIALVPPL